MGPSSHPPRHPPEPTPGDRLESWKEIALYLKKGVRTVQRWEREEGLPVHRHLHDKLGTVYAYKPELDAWWQNGHSRIAQKELTRGVLVRRLVFCGLLAGFVSNALHFIVNSLFLARRWRAALEGLGLQAGAEIAIRIVLFMLILAGGIFAVWLYTLLRPRFGRGPKTGALAGFAFWLMSGLLPAVIWSLSLSEALLIPAALLAIHLGVHLFINVVATLAGAWALEEVVEKRGNRWVLAGAVAALVVAAAGVDYWWPRPQAPVLPFEQRDWVLVGDFENRTGEPALDGVLDYALERELSNSRFVNVVSRQRVEDSLRLMQKPLEARVNLAVGREVCLRDGGIRALLTGRVEKLDSTYMLSVSLVEPASGRAVASFSEEAAGQKEVVAALRLLSNRVRQALGEKLALIHENEQKLEKVTTPSLRALYLFSQGSVLKEQEQYQQAEEFLRQAIAEDPDFASAHLWLAYTVENQRRPESEYMPHVERALALSDRVTEHERYFIRGSSYLFKGDDQKAAAAYEALLRIYPDHYFGVCNLIGVYTRLERYAERSRLILRRGDLRPADYVTNVMATHHAYYYHHNWQATQTYLERTRRALTPEVRAGHAASAVQFDMLPVHRLWMAGNLDEARRLAADVSKRLDSASDRERDALALHVGSFELTLGRLTAAEKAFQNISEKSERGSWLAAVAFVRGEERQAAELADNSFPYLAVCLLLRTGQAPRARQVLRKMDQNEYDAILARAEFALARGAVSEATTALQEADNKHFGFEADSYFLTAASLARFWKQRGELGRAISLLEKISAKEQDVTFVNGYAWFHMRAQLLHLYRQVGRIEDAQKVEQELRQRLRYADPDHPILASLRAAQSSKPTQTKN